MEDERTQEWLGYGGGLWIPCAAPPKATDGWTMWIETANGQLWASMTGEVWTYLQPGDANYSSILCHHCSPTLFHPDLYTTLLCRGCERPVHEANACPE